MNLGLRKALVVLLISGIAWGSDDLIKSDMQQLQGEWKLVGIEIRARICDDEDVLKDHILQISDAKWTMKKGDRILAEAEFKISPSNQPKTIDHRCTKGANAGSTVLGIYLVKGDLLKVAVNKDPDTRPSRFETEPESEDQILYFKRTRK